MKCSNCGRISPEGSKVCMMCGMPFQKVKYCQKCGNLIDSDAIFCPQCGWKYGETVPEPAQETKNLSINSAKQATPKKARGIAWKIFSWIGFVFGLMFVIAYMPSFSGLIFLVFSLILMPIGALQNAWNSMRVKGAIKGILLAVLFIVGVSMSPTSGTEKSDHTDNYTKEPQKVSSEKNQAPSKEEPQKGAVPAKKEREPAEDVSFDTSGYMNIDADVLFEYGNYMGGQKVVTVISVEDVDTHSSMLKARTSNNNGLFFSIVCEFEDVSSIESVAEGDIVTVAGTLQERNPWIDTFSFLETPTASMEKCQIVGYGEIAEDLKAGVADQREIGAQAKKVYEDQVAAAKKEERDSYISQCQTVKYSDVERNPDSYDGKFVKITGDVIQVSEGWFDSVTLRVDCNGNIWLVSYSRENGESRILENDTITCYGKCKGVSSYKTALGTTVTIPSMDMEYYD